MPTPGLPVETTSTGGRSKVSTAMMQARNTPTSATAGMEFNLNIISLP